MALPKNPAQNCESEIVVPPPPPAVYCPSYPFPTDEGIGYLYQLGDAIDPAATVAIVVCDGITYYAYPTAGLGHTVKIKSCDSTVEGYAQNKSECAPALPACDDCGADAGGGDVTVQNTFSPVVTPSQVVVNNLPAPAGAPKVVDTFENGGYIWGVLDNGSTVQISPITSEPRIEKRAVCGTLTDATKSNLLEVTTTSIFGVVQVTYLDPDTSPMRDVTAFVDTINYSGECVTCCEGTSTGGGGTGGAVAAADITAGILDTDVQINASSIIGFCTAVAACGGGGGTPSVVAPTFQATTPTAAPTASQANIIVVQAAGQPTTTYGWNGTQWVLLATNVELVTDFLEVPTNKKYVQVLKAPFAGRIIETNTKTLLGTCNVQWFVNGGAITGVLNNASPTLQSIAHNATFNTGDIISYEVTNAGIVDDLAVSFKAIY